MTDGRRVNGDRDRGVMDEARGTARGANGLDAESGSPAANRSSTIDHRSSDCLLSVERLTTVFDLRGGTAPAVIDVSFHVDSGETLCLVGESGSGKSVTALSILRLVQRPGRIAGG